MTVCLLYPHLFGHDGYVRDINRLAEELSHNKKHRILTCPPRADPMIRGRPGLDELQLVKPLLQTLPEVDLVHIFGFFFPLYPLLTTLIRLSGKPYILSPLGALESFSLSVSSAKKSLFIRMFGKSMLNHAALVHAFSRSEALSIRAITRRPPIMEAPLGIYYEDLPLEIKLPMLRPRNDYFLFFGRLGYFQKGLDVLLDVFTRYLAAGGKIDLVIAGRSWQGSDEKIRRRLEELDLGSRAHFLGEIGVDEKFALMRDCKAFVYPSRSDGPPRPIREALALGKPLLVSRQSNIISDLERYGWGYAYEPKPDQLAAGMKRMETEYDISAYQNPRGVLSWSAVANHYTTMYEHLSVHDSTPMLAY